jgi:hypothetical protein
MVRSVEMRSVEKRVNYMRCGVLKMRTVSISLQSENDIYLRVKMEKKMLLNIHAKFLH